MSVKVIHEEINRFLKSPDPEVLCIKGRWGVGKTFAWSKFVKEVADCAAFDDYSYVSLFGLSSLADLRYSIFENTVRLDSLVATESPTIQQRLKIISGKYKKALSYTSQNPIIQSKLGVSEKLLFLAVRNQIVCIDDLERSGEDLRLLDVLGLASSLKEDRGCKVVLLLNEEELSEDDQTTFKKQLEKVTDTVMVFEPTPKESADLVFDKNDELSNLLKGHCITLGITNIRIIKKIEKHAKTLASILKDYPALNNQIAHSVVLFGWSLYGALGAPPLKFLEDFNNTYAILGGDEYTPEQKAWAETMKDYKFSFFDDFDRAILENLAKGYFDKDQMHTEAARLKDQAVKSEMENEFSEVWDLYHDSFEINDDEVLAKLYAAALKCCSVVSPMNLNGTVVFLKEFGKNEEAQNLIETYVESRSGEKDIFNLADNPFRSDVSDVDVVSAFAEKYASFEDKRDPTELLISIGSKQGWNKEDVTLLSKLSKDDFYTIFKANPGDNLRRIVYGALIFKGNQAEDDEKTAIINNATDALKQIAGESQMNERRVKKYGID